MIKKKSTNDMEEADGMQGVVQSGNGNGAGGMMGDESDDFDDLNAFDDDDLMAMDLS